jgi:hypothetical protein
MYHPLTDLFVIMGMMCVFILGFVAWTIMKNNQQSQDLYGFDLEGWSLIEDDAVLYQISQIFEEGMVAQALQRTGYGVVDFHSNLQKANEPGTKTGFIDLRNYRATASVGFGSMNVGPGLVLVGEIGFRYYIATLAKAQPYLKIFNSGNLATAEELKGLLHELETTHPLNSWQVIFHGNTLVVLVPEITDRAQLVRFLALADSVRKQLS